MSPSTATIGRKSRDLVKPRFKTREQKTLIETLRLLDLSQQCPLTILKFYA
jgi:hypothetical protein